MGRCIYSFEGNLPQPKACRWNAIWIQLSFDCLNVRDAADIDAAVTGWDGILATSGFGSEFICAYVKQNGNGFRCFKPDYPPTTQETAIQRYTARHTPMSICSPLKGNSPFECTREVETPLMTRMNLSPRGSFRCVRGSTSFCGMSRVAESRICCLLISDELFLFVEVPSYISFVPVPSYVRFGNPYKLLN